MNVRRYIYSAAVHAVMLPLIIVYETRQLAQRVIDYLDRAQGAHWSDAVVRAGEATERRLVATFGEWREHPDENL